MSRVKVLKVFVLLSALCLVDSSKLIYRRYEKQHPKRKYVQIVEIFDTRNSPPAYLNSERDLNNFLAKDSYKSDMNCTKSNETEAVTTTTPFPTVPTTVYQRPTYPSTIKPTTMRPTTIRPPNLDDLFTIPTRTTKPTIKPNPKENNNPDYTNVIPWPSLNVQVTKHPPRINTPTIVIKETDDHSNKNHTTLSEVDKNSRRTTIRTTTRRPTMTTVTTTVDPLDDEIVYHEIDDDYHPNNYPEILTSDQYDQYDNKDQENEYDEDENFDGEEGEEYDERQKRRKRQRVKAVTPLKRHYRVKT